jgi:hypothetical protein
MGKEIRYVRKTGTELTAEQIERIEAARQFEDEYDEDCPEIDPIKTPELYEALVKATAERNRRVDKILREAAV